jgi:hypothetical protein
LDAFIDPEELPDDPDAGTWEPGPDPDGPEPSAEDLAGATEVFGGTDALRRLDRSNRLRLAKLVDRQTDYYRGWGNPAGARRASSGAIHPTPVQRPGTATPAIRSGPTRFRATIEAGP